MSATVASPHFDHAAFYAALDAQRSARRLCWKDVAEQSGVSQPVLTRIGQGNVPIIDNIAKLCVWMGMDIYTFLHLPTPDVPLDTLTRIAQTLYADPRLDVEAAQAIDATVRLMYEQIVRLSSR